MRALRIPLIASAVLAITSAGCGEKTESSGTCPTISTAVTYTTHIQPILEASCNECHASTVSGTDRQFAPDGIDYDTYADAVANSERGNIRIAADTMPPPACADCTPLSDEAKNLFCNWINQGTPE